MLYKQLIQSDVKDRWLTAMCKELGRLSNRYKELTKGMKAMEFMTRTEVNKIPKKKKITYARITADFREQKADLYRIRLTVGGNLIDFPGPTMLTTAELKIMEQSIIYPKRTFFVSRCKKLLSVYTNEITRVHKNTL